MPRCAFCGQEARTSIDIGFIVAGAKIPACKRCFNSIAVCHVCGEPVEGQGEEVEGLGVVHPQCLEKLFADGLIRTCEICHRPALVKRGRVVKVDGVPSFVGTDCLRTLRRCTLCGELTTSNDLCELCSRGRVRRYSYKPKLNLTASSPLYGIEIEVTGFGAKRNEVGRMLYKISNKEKNYWLKADSSIGPDGIEIVSAPRTMRGWLAGLEMLENAMGIVQEHGFTDSRTGMHIHRSRSDLTYTDILKVSIFMYRCRQKIFKFAGRDESRYSKMDRLHHIYSLARSAGSAPAFDVIAQDILYTLQDHYASLSSGGNGGKTLELRIFASTLDPSKILANIAFYHYMVSFVKKQEGGSLLAMSSEALWKMFTDYVKRLPYKSARILSNWI